MNKIPKSIRVRRAPSGPLLLACAVAIPFAAAVSLASCTSDSSPSPAACANAAGIACFDAAIFEGGIPPFDANELPDGTFLDVASPPQDDGGANDAAEVDAACGDGGTTCGANCVDTRTDLQNCGGCGLVCGGTCTAGHCLLAVAPAQNYPWHVAVDSTSVYWTSNDLVLKAPIGGGAVVVLASGDGPIAVDGTSVYWADDHNNAISKAPLTGVPDGGTATVLAPGQSTIYSNASMALDGTGVYWVSSNGGTDSILKAPLTGVPDGGSPLTVASVPGLIHGITVDGTGVYLTWTHTGGTPTVAATAPLTGVADGGAPTTLVTTGVGSPVAIAVDATRIYWADNGGGAILAAPKSGLPDGSAPTALATGLNYPFGIAIDGTSVYWTDNVNSTGAVQKAPLTGVPDGGSPTTLATTQDKPSYMAIDGTSIYWADNVPVGAVMRLTPK